MTTLARPVTPIGILAERLDDLAGRLMDDGADPKLVIELRAARELAAGLDPYLSACSTPESAALSQLALSTRQAEWAGGLEQEMLSGHVEGQLLKFLVRASRARRVLEIGMFTGYSALAMAEALPEDGEVVACEIDPDVAAFAQQCFEASSSGHRIRVVVGPAVDTLCALDAAGERFDLVFLDADKSGYAGYLDLLLDTNLLAPHAVVCVDNTLLQGETYVHAEASANGAAIGSFNQVVAEDPRIEQVLVPLRDGLTLICRAGQGSQEPSP